MYVCIYIYIYIHVDIHIYTYIHRPLGVKGVLDPPPLVPPTGQNLVSSPSYMDPHVWGPYMALHIWAPNMGPHTRGLLYPPDPLGSEVF